MQCVSIPQECFVHVQRQDQNVRRYFLLYHLIQGYSDTFSVLCTNLPLFFIGVFGICFSQHDISRFFKELSEWVKKLC